MMQNLSCSLIYLTEWKQSPKNNIVRYYFAKGCFSNQLRAQALIWPSQATLMLILLLMHPNNISYLWLPQTWKSSYHDLHQSMEEGDHDGFALWNSSDRMEIPTWMIRLVAEDDYYTKMSKWMEQFDTEARAKTFQIYVAVSSFLGTMKISSVFRFFIFFNNAIELVT